MIFLVSQALSQISLNGSFERYNRTYFLPALWSVSGDSQISIDTTIAKHGKASLKIASNRIGRDSIRRYYPSGLATAHEIPISIVKNKRCRISGYIKTQDVRADSNTQRVGFFVKMYNKNGENFYVHVSDSSTFRRTNDWQFHSVNFSVPDSAVMLLWGAAFIGSGTVWYDNLTVTVDGKVLDDPEIAPPSPQETRWIQQNVKLLNSDGISQTNIALTTLKKESNTAKIIALGEATHGTSEFFSMKHRLLEYLANETNVGVFAIEAYMPEAYKVNDYVLHGKGTPEDCVYGMQFWTWRNEEVVNLIKWMKEYNDNHAKKIRFWGFDMQSSQQARENIRTFVSQTDSAFLPRYNNLNNIIENIENTMNSGMLPDSLIQVAITQAKETYQILSERAKQYAQYAPTSEIQRIIQDCRIVIQSLTILRLSERESNTYRDSCMAENIRWIASQTKPDERIVLWAHNGHIMKSPQTEGITMMGEYLNKMFGKQYYTIGFSCGSGSYTAYNFDSSKVVRTNRLTEPHTGTIESYFQSANISSGLFLTKNITKTSPVYFWSTTPLELRSIGSVAEKQQYHVSLFPKYFDAFIYIANTTASKLLPPRQKR